MWKILLLLCLVGCTYQIEDDQMTVTHGWGATRPLRNTGRAPGNGLSVQTPSGDAEPSTYTVSFRVGQLKLDSPQNPLLTTGYAPYAEIYWSLGGIDTRRVVSVVNGTSVTGVCDTFKVIGYDDTFQGSGINHGTYDLAIAVGKGTRPADANPPFYIDPVTGGEYAVNPASSVNVAVPFDIGVKSLQVTAIAFATGVTLAEGDARVAQNAPFTSKIYDPREYPGFVPLLPGASTIQLINNQPAIGGSVIIFQVTWGIDG